MSVAVIHIIIHKAQSFTLFYMIPKKRQIFLRQASFFADCMSLDNLSKGIHSSCAQTPKMENSNK